MNKKKLIVIGLDGLIPEMVLKFAREGIIPNMKKLIVKGVFSSSLPVPETTTATNWATLSTGSWAGTHKVDSFATHIPGRPFTNYHRFQAMPDKPGKAGTINRAIQCETIWESANKQNRTILLINWPFTWPPSIRKGVVVAETGPTSQLAELYGALEYNTHLPAKDSFHTKLSFEKNKNYLIGKLSLIPSQEESPVYYIRVKLNSRGIHPSELEIYRKPSDRKPLAILLPGKWSSWFTADIKKIRNVRSSTNAFAWEKEENKYKGIFKFKLKALDSKRSLISLYRTPIFNTWGWTYPDNLGFKLVDSFIKEYGEEMASWRMGKFRLSEYYEAANPINYLKDNFLERDISSMRDLTVVTNLCGKLYDWDIILVQVHAPDTLNHYKVGQITPGALGYDKSKVKTEWNYFRKEYKAIDQFVGEITKQNADSNTVVAVVSDHGGIATDRQVWLDKFLIDEGLTVFEKKKDGNYYFNEKRSKVYVSASPCGSYIWLNLKGRDPYGIVRPKEAEKMVDRILEILSRIRDPRTGKSPLALVLRKNEAKLLGLWGDNIGDIVYFYREGYMQPEFSGIGPISQKEYSDFTKDGFQNAGYNYPDCYSQHKYMPNAKYGPCSVCGVFLAAGPGLRKGYQKIQPIWMVDVIPTLCRAIGIEAPKNCEGRVIEEFFS